VGILNNLLQIVGLKKGLYIWHSVLAHCFSNDMHYVLSFGYFVFCCYRGVSFFVLMLTYVLSVFHLHCSLIFVLY